MNWEEYQKKVNQPKTKKMADYQRSLEQKSFNDEAFSQEGVDKQLFKNLRERGIKSMEITKELKDTTPKGWKKHTTLDNLDEVSNKVLGGIGTVLSAPFQAILSVEKGIGAGVTALAQKATGKEVTWKKNYEQADTAGSMVAKTFEEISSFSRQKQGKPMGTVDFFMPEFIGELVDVAHTAAVLSPIAARVANKFKVEKITAEQVGDYMTGRKPQGAPLTENQIKLLKNEFARPETQKSILKDATKFGVEFRSTEPAGFPREFVAETFLGGRADKAKTREVLVNGKNIKDITPQVPVAPKLIEGEIPSSMKIADIEATFKNAKATLTEKALIEAEQVKAGKPIEPVQVIRLEDNTAVVVKGQQSLAVAKALNIAELQVQDVTPPRKVATVEEQAVNEIKSLSKYAQDIQQRPETRKGVALEFNTIQRHIEGRATPTEIKNAQKYLDSNYIGKRVEVGGMTGVVEKIAFGKIGVKVDGQVKYYPKEQVVAPKATTEAVVAYLKEQAFKNLEGKKALYQGFDNKKQGVAKEYKEGQDVVFQGKKGKITAVLKLKGDTKFEITYSNGKKIWTNKGGLDSENTTQKETVVKAVKEKAKSIKEIAAETKIKEANVRRILGVGAKEGTFTRVDKGVYTLSHKGKEIAFVEVGDALEVLPRLVKEGKKYDQILSDLPYRGGGQQGGAEKGKKKNLAKFDIITPGQYSKVISHYMDLLRNNDSTIVHIMTTGGSTAAKAAQFNNALLNYPGLKLVAVGEYIKLKRNGERTNIRRFTVPPEQVLIFNKSGNTPKNILPKFEVKAVAPYLLDRNGSYQTQKARELMDVLINSTERGDSVLDPFAGSGVYGEAAIKAGRTPYLIEKNPDTVENYIKPRLENAVKVYQGKKKVVTEKTKSWKKVVSFKNNQKEVIAEMAEVDPRAKAIAEKYNDVEADAYLAEAFGNEGYDVINYRNEHRPQVGNEYHDLAESKATGEQQFYAEKKETAEVYAMQNREAKYDGVQVASDLRPVGNTGEFAESKLASDVRARLEKELAAELAEVPLYEKMNQEKQAADAMDFVLKETAQALEVIRGNRLAPEGLIPESIFSALEKVAKKTGDGGLMFELAKSPMSLAETAMGQRLSFLQTRESTYSPVEAMKQINATRTQRVLDKYKAKTKEEVIKQVAPLDKLRQSMKRTRPPEVKTWEEFIDQIKC